MSATDFGQNWRRQDISEGLSRKVGADLPDSEIVRTLSSMVCTLALLLTDVVGLAVTMLACLCFFHSFFPVDRFGRLNADLFSQFSGLLNALLPYCLGLLLFLLSRGHYHKRLPFWRDLRDLCAVSLASLAIYCLTQSGPRGSAIYQAGVESWLALPVVLVALRRAVKTVLAKAGLWQIPVVIVGDQRGIRVAQEMFRLERLMGYRSVGLIELDHASEMSSGVEWRSTLRQLRARRLVLALNMNGEAEQKLLRSVVADRVPFMMIPPASELPVMEYEHVSFLCHDSILMVYKSSLTELGNKLIKTGLDILIASFLLILFSPFMLLLAALIRRDGGPALFSHERVGLGGRKFCCLKFRSMVTDPEPILRDTLLRDPRAAQEWAEKRKLTNDPRVTRIGRFLRATSLDELPQLLNVMRLEMSLVGPRPIVEEELPQYGDDLSYYYKTRPGLTGLWQVSGRSNTSYEKRIQLDRWYVKNWTLWHDLMILAMTVPAVLNRCGAR